MKIREVFCKIIIEGVKGAFSGIEINEIDIERSVVFPAVGHADISSSIALRIAGRLRMKPSDVASKIAEKIKAKSPISGIETSGGYINASIDETIYGREVVAEVVGKGSSYGSAEIGKSEKVIIEYPSVNPNKPWLIGHLRNALLGDSLSKIFSFCSYSVEREDYIDDMGLQMAVLLYGNVGKPSEEKYDLFLGERYAKISKEIENSNAEEKVNAILKKMEENGSRENLEVRKIAEDCVMAQYQTAFLYGVQHDVLMFESDILKSGLFKKAMAMLDKNGMLKRPSEGKYSDCVVLDIGEGKVLVRSNGVPTYLAKDIAFHMWKLGLINEKFKYRKFITQPDGSIAYASSDNGEYMKFGGAKRIINVIGSAQSLNQNMLGEALMAIGAESGSIMHLAYGEIELKEGSLSGRKGEWLGEEVNYTADDLFYETRKRVDKLVEQSSKAGKRAGVEGAAEKVAIAAIKFEFLRIDPLKKVTFEWERALDLNASSGAYCMYMYARASGILDRTGGVELEKIDYSKITRGADFELLKLIGNADEIVKKACIELKPNVIAEYLLEISSAFSRFYETLPVITGGDSKNARVAIVMATKQIINNMLNLLGIEASERM